MTQDDIIAMAREAGFETMVRKGRICGFDRDNDYTEELQAFAIFVAAAERNKVAAWMMAQGYATGHGDTMEQLLEELGGQAIIRMVRVAEERVKAEREACLNCYSPDDTAQDWADKIRARGQA